MLVNGYLDLARIADVLKRLLYAAPRGKQEAGPLRDIRPVYLRLSRTV